MQKYSFETTATNGRPNHDKKQKFCLSCKMQLKTNPKSTNKFCDNRWQQEFQYHKYIAAWQSGKISGNRGKRRNLTNSNNVKRFLKEKHGEKCSIYGWIAVNPITKRVPITFDHKDGNPLNSRKENLRILCPICHSLTETYGALNRGQGRESKKMGLW